MTISSVSSDGYCIPVSSLSPKRLREIQAELTVRPQVTIEYAKPKPFKIYKVLSGCVVVPRAWGTMKFGLAPYVGRKGASIDVAMAHGFQLDPSRHQPEAVAAILRQLRGSYAGGLLSLHTGAGKTVIATYLIAQMRLKTLVLVHKTFLLNQWQERLQTFLPGARIGRIQGHVCDVDCDVCIATIQSVALKDYGNAFDDFGLVFVDECHVICTRVFCRALEKAQARYMVGLSATVHRKDKLERVIQNHLGDVIFSAERQNMTAAVRLVYSDVSNFREIFNAKTQKVDRVAMVSELVQCEKRNLLIVSEIARYADIGRKLLVLSERRQHLLTLQSLLLRDGYSDTGLYIGGMSQAQLDEASHCQIILGSYSMASTGLDIKDMSCLVLASPLTDITQACGRILRNTTVHSKVIVDVVDRISVFLGQMRRRVSLYHKQAFDVCSDVENDKLRQTSLHESRVPRQLAIME